MKSICLFPKALRKFYPIHLHAFSIYLDFLSSELDNLRILYLEGGGD